MPISAELVAVVMAGGSGTRFWPLSRRRRPKQLLPFAGGRSLLSAAVERLLPLVPASRVLVVTGAGIADEVRADLPALPADNVLAEPAGRDTAACIGWVAWRLLASAPDAVMLVVPADHAIPDGAALRRALAAAAEVAARRDALVTLGLAPTGPEPGFGYLELDPQSEVAGELVAHPVRRFVEKPGRERAAELLASGDWRWNSGMFAWRVRTIVAAVREHLPALASALDRLVEDAASMGEAAALAAHYPGLPRTSIDFGVMEKAREVWAVPVRFAWSDVGSWPGLAAVLPEHPAGTVLGDVVALDCERSVLVSEGPLLAAVGLRDVVVVATADAVLVLPRAEAQRVREVVDRLEARGRTDVL
ncbi:MAG TPA: sugar phosphate nucleotidyltransferase [Thermoanaerobaculaceae bacterium]|nr:sugar phosphate nucleotidyltransferase [Thermoanaerobaculaceae bacterium]HRS15897.1 sugar phosphate nucleotidyltransferase [Thermoanaerobaculaceae bacterium]